MIIAKNAKKDEGSQQPQERGTMRATRFFAIILTACALVYLSSPSRVAASSYSGAWVPDPGEDVLVIDLTQSSGSGSLYMYDWGDINDELFLISDGTYCSVNIYFQQQNNGTWLAGTAPDHLTLNLGDTNEFGFYFQDGSNTYTNYDLQASGAGYLLTENNTKMTVFVDDANPVPIPPAVWLLGSGFLCLALSRRRRRRS